MRLTGCTALTFDVYGTLIDRKTGMVENLKPLTDPGGLRRHHEARDITAGDVPLQQHERDGAKGGNGNDLITSTRVPAPAGPGWFDRDAQATRFKYL